MYWLGMTNLKLDVSLNLDIEIENRDKIIWIWEIEEGLNVIQYKTKRGMVLIDHVYVPITSYHADRHTFKLVLTYFQITSKMRNHYLTENRWPKNGIVGDASFSSMRQRRWFETPEKITIAVETLIVFFY